MIAMMMMNQASMNAMGVNNHQTQQLRIGINKTSSINNNHQQEHGGEDGKSGEE